MEEVNRLRKWIDGEIESMEEVNRWRKWLDVGSNLKQEATCRNWLDMVSDLMWEVNWCGKWLRSMNKEVPWSSKWLKAWKYFDGKWELAWLLDIEQKFLNSAKKLKNSMSGELKIREKYFRISADTEKLNLDVVGKKTLDFVKEFSKSARTYQPVLHWASEILQQDESNDNWDSEKHFDSVNCHTLIEFKINR